MRVLPATLVASVLAHAAIVGGLAAMAPERAPRRRGVPVIELVEPTPIEVVMVSPPSPSPIRAGLGLGLGVERPDAQPPRAAPSGMGPTTLAMRRRGSVDIELPTAITRRMIEDETGIPVPPPLPVSGMLAPAGRGFVVHDLVTSVDVDADGTAHFHDRPDFDVRMMLPLPSLKSLRNPEKMVEGFAHGVGDMIDQWAADPYAQTEAPSVAELPRHEQAVPGGWDSLGGGGSSVAANTASNGTIPILGGSFDLTSWATRLAGGDPYQARKQRLLDTTIEERAALRAVHRTAQLERSAELMRGNLDRLWARTLEPAARRTALFELWDECEEGDDDAGAAGQRARDQVIGWIRARLPAGSSNAYSIDEIQRLDATRRSRQPFAPYPPPTVVSPAPVQ